MGIENLIANPAQVHLPTAMESVSLQNLMNERDLGRMNLRNAPEDRALKNKYTLAQIAKYGQENRADQRADEQWKHKQNVGDTIGFLSIGEQNFASAWPEFRKAQIERNGENASKLPEQWTPALLPKLDALAKSGLSAEQFASQQQEKAAYPAGGAPTSPAPWAPPAPPAPTTPMQVQPQDMVDPTSGAEVRPQNLATPDGVPLSEIGQEQPTVPQTIQAPPMEVTAPKPNGTPDSLRKQADEMENRGGKVNYEKAKDLRARAEKLDDRIFKERDQTQFFSDLGITGNKATGKFEKDGVPISAAEVQKLALEHAKARSQSITVENYPNPTTVTDKVTGEQKSIQFGKKGSFREVPYAPSASDAERLAAGFHDRMDASEKILGEIGPKGYPTAGIAAIGAIPGIGEVAERAASSDAQQKYQQAQRDWVRAKLRKESGAAIGEKEMQDEIDTYFPRVGDRKEVIEQKTRSRVVAQDAMKKNAGPALRPKAPIKPEPSKSTLSPEEQSELDELRKRFKK